MTKRKKLIIDKKFQFKTTFKIIGVVYLLFLIVIAGTVINAVSNNKHLEEIIRRQNRTVEVQKDVLSVLGNFPKKMSPNKIFAAHRQIAEEVDYNLGAMTNNTSAVEQITKNNTRLLYGIIIFIVIQAIVLYFILIRTTHHISGPIYHISGYIREITKGKYPAIRPLREHDEFKEFHELVVKMAESLKKKLKK